MDELKSCPFCGETSVFVRYKVDYYPLSSKNLVYQVVCPTCGIRTKKDTSYTDTVDRWNKRVSNDIGKCDSTLQIKAVTLEEYKQQLKELKERRARGDESGSKSNTGKS